MLASASRGFLWKSGPPSKPCSVDLTWSIATALRNMDDLEPMRSGPLQILGPLHGLVHNRAQKCLETIAMVMSIC